MVRWHSQQSPPPLQARPRGKRKFWQRPGWMESLVCSAVSRWGSRDLVGLGFLDPWDCLEEPHGRPYVQVYLSAFLTVLTISDQDTSWAGNFISHEPRRNSLCYRYDRPCIAAHLFLFLEFYVFDIMRVESWGTYNTGPYCRSWSCSGHYHGVPRATGAAGAQSCPAGCPERCLPRTLENHLFPSGLSIRGKLSSILPSPPYNEKEQNKKKPKTHLESCHSLFATFLLIFLFNRTPIWHTPPFNRTVAHSRSWPYSAYLRVSAVDYIFLLHLDSSHPVLPHTSLFTWSSRIQSAGWCWRKVRTKHSSCTHGCAYFWGGEQDGCPLATFGNISFKKNLYIFHPNVAEGFVQKHKEGKKWSKNRRIHPERFKRS